MLLIYWNSSSFSGGVDVLVARFAHYLQSIGTPFLIVAPREAWLRNEFGSSHFICVEELPIIESSIDFVFVPSVMSLANPQFPWRSFPKAKLFSLIVHPNDVFFSFYPYWTKLMNLLSYKAVPLLRTVMKSHRLIFDSLFEQMTAAQSLAVIDGATQRSFMYYLPGISVMPELVPIPAGRACGYDRKLQDGVLSIGYFGRMDGMKWSALAPFLSGALLEMAQERPVQLLAITGGTHVQEFESACSALGIPLELHSFMPNNEAKELLVNRCDVAVAMGTSALDLAAEGLPVVVLDPALGMFAAKQAYFRYIHDSNDYTLGEYRDFPRYVRGRMSFQQLCEPLLLAAASVDGRGYVREAHGDLGVFSKLHSLILSSTLEIGQVSGIAARCVDSLNFAREHPFKAMCAGR